MNVTAPLPVPLAGLTVVIQLALLAAVHVQPAPAVTVVELDPPALPRFALDGAMERLQPPAWDTVKAWPATVNVPVRAGPGFA